MSGVGQAKTLAELLKNRRLDLKGSNKEVTQPEIASAIKQSQAQVWKIENNQTDITKWFPERQLALLQAYRFSDKEIHEIAEKFGLDIPEVKNATSENLGQLGKVENIFITGVGTHGDLERVPMSSFFLVGHEPEDVTLITAGGECVLVCPEARERLIEGWAILFDRSLEPEEGDTVLYRIKGHNLWILRVWRASRINAEMPVSRFDGEGWMMMKPGDPEVEVYGVKFNAMQPGRDSRR